MIRMGGVSPRTRVAPVILLGKFVCKYLYFGAWIVALSERPCIKQGTSKSGLICKVMSCVQCDGLNERDVSSV